MEAYSRYNLVKIDPINAPKTTFTSKHGNYYYNVTFGLKNVGATYQRLVDAMFSK